MKNDTLTLLEFIFKNADMGKRTLPPIMDRTENQPLKMALRDFLTEYTDICAQAEIQLIACGHTDPKGLSIPEKIMSDMAVRMNTAKDDSPSNLADMLIKGGAMGVTDISKQLHTCEQASEDAKALARRLRKCNEDIIERMKDFLSVIS